MIAPPRLASRLLRAFAPRADAEWIARDLEEEMQLVARSRGRSAAARWYWTHVLRSLPPLAWRRVTAATKGETNGGDGMWHELRQDFSYAMRLSGRSPLTTAAVVATIILGVGVTTAVFSVVDAVVIRPLPFDGSSRTVQLFGFVRRGAEIPSLAYPDLQDFRARARSIEALGIGARASATIAIDGEPQRLNLVEIDSGFVRVLGLHAGLGRFFASDEFTVASPKVIVLANGFWRRAFGANPNVVGQTMALDGEPHIVIGVLPEGGFTYPTTVPDAMIPLRIAAGASRLRRGAMWAEAVARLRPGVSVEEAQRELSAIAEQIGVEFKDANEGIGVRVKPLRDAVVGPAGRLLALLGAGVAAVLLIACLNVGNLLLARASTRGREFAVRAALGGSRGRIRRQVMTESVFLALIGGVTGAVVAPLLTHAIVAYYPGELPRAAEVGINYRVAAAALIATALAAILAGIPAMRRAGGKDLSFGLRDGGRSGLTRGARAFAGTIVATQIGASLVLMFVAGLVVATFMSMSRVSLGFDPQGVIAFQVVPTAARHRGIDGAVRYYENVDAALRRVPGVSEVASMTHVPFFPGWQGDVFYREDKGDRGPQNPQTSITAASPGFERTLRLRVTSGRSFLPADDSLAPRVVMINAALARSAFAGEEPIGKTIYWNGKPGWRIVGILDDARDASVIEPPPPMLYVATPQNPRRGRYVVVRSSRSADQTIPLIRRAMSEIDPTIPLNELRTQEAGIDRAGAAYRFRAWLLASLGALAALLAIVGVYGVVSDAVARRTREIGIRMALGQDAASVSRGILATVLRVAGIGAALGVAGSLAAGRSMASMLYGVRATEPVLLVAAVVSVLAVATAAAFIPARRASRIDPVQALRVEG